MLRSAIRLRSFHLLFSFLLAGISSHLSSCQWIFPYETHAVDQNIVDDGSGIKDGPSDAFNSASDQKIDAPNAALDQRVQDANLDLPGDSKVFPSDKSPSLDLPPITDQSSEQDQDKDTIPDAIDPQPTQKNTILYYNATGVSASDFDTNGTWSSQGDALCQFTPSDNHYRTVLKNKILSASDYWIESRINILGSNTASTNWAGAGIGFRTGSINYAKYDSYACEIDVQNMRVVLSAFINSQYTMLDATAAGSLGKQSTYRLRAVAIKNNLTCMEVNSGLKVQLSDSQISKGLAGFYTYQTSVCFDYLLIIAPP